MKLIYSFPSIFLLAFLVQACEFVSSHAEDTRRDVVGDSLGLFSDSTLNSLIRTEPAASNVRIVEDEILFVIDSTGRKIRRKTFADSLRRELDHKPKHIYFTFDDGPLLGSKAIDSIATLKNIKINTFLVGKHANMSKRLKQDYLIYYKNPLVDCYNHSYSHAGNKYAQFYSHANTAFNDFLENEMFLNLQHKIARLPGRNIWIFDDVKIIDMKSGEKTAELLYQNGYRIYGWDLEWKINGATGVPDQSVEQLYNRIKSYMKNKSSLYPNNVVLLLHDDMFKANTGQQLLVGLIDSLKSNTDYHFEHMRSYPFRY